MMVLYSVGFLLVNLLKFDFSMLFCLSFLILFLFIFLDENSLVLRLVISFSLLKKFSCCDVWWKVRLILWLIRCIGRLCLWVSFIVCFSLVLGLMLSCLVRWCW